MRSVKEIMSDTLDGILTPIASVIDYISDNFDNPVVMIGVIVVILALLILDIVVLVLLGRSVENKILTNIKSNSRKCDILYSGLCKAITVVMAIIGFLIGGPFGVAFGILATKYVFRLIAYNIARITEKKEIASEVAFIENNYSILVNQELSNGIRDYLNTGFINPTYSGNIYHLLELSALLDEIGDKLDYDDHHYNYTTKYGTVKKIKVTQDYFESLPKSVTSTNGILVNEDGFCFQREHIYINNRRIWVYFAYAYILL